jgi:hypothetical protein
MSHRCGDDARRRLFPVGHRMNSETRLINEPRQGFGVLISKLPPLRDAI